VVVVNAGESPATVELPGCTGRGERFWGRGEWLGGAAPGVMMPARSAGVWPVE